MDLEGQYDKINPDGFIASCGRNLKCTKTVCENYDKIYRYCYYRLHDQWLAEDVTQETFLRFFESGTYQDQGRPLAYLYTVARNLCIDESRRMETEPLPEFLPVEDPVEPLLDSIVLQNALGTLTDGERELIFLRYVNEMPMADLTAMYHRSRYSLYREIRAILKRLRQECEKIF